eukprot:7233980-Prymnesium_polylepis.1
MLKLGLGAGVWVKPCETLCAYSSATCASLSLLPTFFVSPEPAGKASRLTHGTGSRRTQIVPSASRRYRCCASAPPSASHS